MKRNELMLAAVAGLFAQEPTSGSAAASTPAPAGDKGTTQAGEPRKRAPATNKLDIARGRLPLLFVHSIRFKEQGTNAEIAKKYATSVGKVFDIKKGRNFDYIKDGFKPTAEDVANAQKWAAEAAKHGGDQGGLGDVVAAYKVATPEEAKAQSEAITAARSKGGGTKPAVAGAAPSAPANTAGKAGPATAAQKGALVS
jgi:hypothetical protein